MTRTRYTLDDIGGALPYRALRHFVGHLGLDSALGRELADPDGRMRAWSDGTIVPALLADVFDAVMLLDAHVVARAGGRFRRPKPYPRPWERERGVRHFGSGPIPIRDFDAWWDEHIMEVT